MTAGKYIGAADIGGTTIKLGLFDTGCRLIKSWEIPTDLSESGTGILPELCAELKRAACDANTDANANTDADTDTDTDSVYLGKGDKSSNCGETESVEDDGDSYLTAVGIAVPAAVDEYGVARNCTNIGWGTIDLRKEVGELLPNVDVLCFANDAAAAALGELKFGAAKGLSSAYMITLGTGVGGGFISDGRVVNGAFGAAGEIGHIIINPRESTPCKCGRRGCLEQYASASGVVRLAANIIALKNADYDDSLSMKVSEKESLCLSTYPCCEDDTDKHMGTDISRSNDISVNTNVSADCDSPSRIHIESLFELSIPKEESSLESMDNFSARDICRLAEEGDKLSCYVLKIFGKCMGLAMSSISCTADPNCYIIGGGMSRAGDIVLKAIREGYEEYAYPASRYVSIRLSKLSNEAGIYGSAAMAAEAHIIGGQDGGAYI